MGTLTNGTVTIEFENPDAPGLAWQKSSKTDLHPIVKECVIVADAGVADGHPHFSIPDGTRMIALSDDKLVDGQPVPPVLHFSRAEFTKFVQGVKDGEFDHLLATAEELEAAAALEPSTPVA